MGGLRRGEKGLKRESRGGGWGRERVERERKSEREYENRTFEHEFPELLFLV